MPSPRRGRIAYLLLETPIPGQATATHANEIMSGLRRLDWHVEAFVSRGGGASSGSSVLRRLFGYVTTQAALIVALHRFDALYVRAHFMAQPTAFMARLLGKPIIHEVNGMPVDLEVTYPWLRPFRRVLNWLYRYQFRHATRLLPVTDGLGGWLRSFAGHERITVVPNGANLDMFNPDGGTLEMPGRQGPYVVFVGGLVRWHGIETMVAAAGDPSWPQDVRLVFVGDGAERDTVLRAASASRDGRVFWFGRADYQIVPSILRGALAALCPIEDPLGRSSHGVAPLKLFEAMACGKPVIVSDLPYQGDLVRSIGAGLVVAPQNAAELAAAVRKLANDEALRISCGKAAYAYMRDHGSWQKRAEQVSDLLAAHVKPQQ